MVEKIALITGGTKGLGRKLAQLLSAINYKIILTGRSQHLLENVRKELMNADKHILVCGDLLNKNTLKNIYNLPVLPSVMVHTIGGKIQGDEQPLSPEILQKSIDLNLGIAAHLNAHYLPLMQKARYGRIVHIGSDASETGQSAPGYAASKAAINAYVKSTARFYAKNNIMICAVLPGNFEYLGNVWDEKKVNDPDDYQKRLQKMPLGRFLFCEEVAELIFNIVNSDSMAYAGSLVKLTGGH